ncbi:Histidine kinase [Pseudodesulfovibrio profundus]|uniref:histidine kinase n=1 Tax=Pseudodesulfovibrio profundus TaxID=57320 RepID=A0A2C8F9P8_9BACT|nr:HAMP domain-containing sensor histidine kinase [Pseudodesulfovibrio profundus]MBC17746.1 ATP-binding protein [Desulfovibrio sp.]SOB59151.1 Histidine kinase [Pseudodesulfovibrio profundus]|tara:strand:- start:31035 stop:32447 length:1413 start_codon:yes stop_codon:yes gene_type:complete
MPDDRDDAHNGLTSDGYTTEEERNAYVIKRIEEKLDDYQGYDFSMREVRALNIFFELAQEFRGRDMFYAVCMMIPRSLFGLECNIYLLEDEETFALAGCSTSSCDVDRTYTWNNRFTNRVVRHEDRLYIPINCNPEFADLLPFNPPHNIIGSFEFFPCNEIDDNALLFLEKFVNRVGFQLHHRIIRSRNREHLQFIKSMVQDIGHNVIVPNMYFKLYFNRLKRQIEQLHVITEKVLSMMVVCSTPDCVEQGNSLARTTASIERQYKEIYRHYETTSMFLETLLRRRHFEEGRYVLVKREVNLRVQVLEPQLERYRQRLDERGIELNFAMGGAPDQMIRLVMDPGLIAQVYANFFSNAIKYTKKSTLPDGRTGKFVSYGWEVIKDFFGEGAPGIRMWVTSTGNSLNLEDPLDVFKPGYRAGNVASESGTGRGLYFVRQVVELHKGTVGYRHTQYGNEFSFTLPFEQRVEPD